MGEVYRAVDRRLKRDVAIKVLPPSVASDGDRLARFQREAELLAAMDHPNIARVFGLEVSDGRPALVMELIEGPTLAERLREGALPLDTAVSIATQIADALEAAHERGVVHRDLKPVNVKVRRDGVVKVLDFGLAKSVAPPSAASSGALTDSPTATSPAHVTASGVVLGTAAYMAPEQAKGDEVGRPADVWAFGCVLYEMLVGAPPFRGGSVAEVIGEVLKTDPDMRRLPADTPESLRRLLRRSFVKDPRKRLQHLGDARLELSEPLPESTTSAAVAPSGARATLPWALALVAAVAAGAAVLRPEAPREPRLVTRVDLNLPPRVEVSTTAAPSATISPDGTKVVFTGQEGGFRRLYVRDLRETDAHVFIATDASSQCYFSPDGTAVTYVASDRTIRRLSLSDGLTTVLARGVDRNFGATWGGDGRITVTVGGALHQLPESGGTPSPLTQLDTTRGEIFHAWPTPVPGRAALLFTVASTDTQNGHRIDAVDPATRKRHTVVDGGAYPLIARDGPLVFFRDGVLVAAPFDRERLVVTGPAVKLVEDVALDNLGAPLASLSASGAFIYVSRAAASGRLVSVTRQGLATPLVAEERVYDFPRLSPDATRLASFVSGDVWQLDLARAAFTRVTRASTIGNSYAVWTPDGQAIVYRTARGLYVAAADGGGVPRLIAETLVADFPQAVTGDGKTLIFTRQTADASGDVYALSLEGAPAPHAIFSTPAYEGGAVLSPDGRWLAYASNESGRYEVYVRHYPDAARKWSASPDGGTQPMWSRDGKELFYRSGSRMLAVSVAGDVEPRLGRPVTLFDQDFSYGTGITFAQYDVLPDGRFVMVKRDAAAGRLNVVLNWTDELTRLTSGPRP